MTLRRSQRLAERVAASLEKAGWLDVLARPVHEAATRITRTSAPAQDALSGTGLGHPAHPALIVGPLGCWTGALISDLAQQPSAARTLTGAGVVLAVPTALTGLSDWVDTTGAEQRVGFVHLCANTTAVTLFAASWRARAGRRHAVGVGLAAAGVAVASAAAWLGGHLSYAMGVGVDTTAFDGGPTEWTRIERDPDNPHAASVGSVSLLIDEQDGNVRVLAGRCTHRGGPLAEGTIADGCVTCPWHNSRFSLEDGSVQTGPAVAPQPIYEVERRSDGVYVRRLEERSLRVYPVRGRE